MLTIEETIDHFEVIEVEVGKEKVVYTKYHFTPDHVQSRSISYGKADAFKLGMLYERQMADNKLGFTDDPLQLRNCRYF